MFIICFGSGVHIVSLYDTKAPRKVFVDSGEWKFVFVFLEKPDTLKSLRTNDWINSYTNGMVMIFVQIPAIEIQMSKSVCANVLEDVHPFGNRNEVAFQNE